MSTTISDENSKNNLNKQNKSEVKAGKQDNPTVKLLGNTFLLQYPGKAARALSEMSLEEAADILEEQPYSTVARILDYLPGGIAEKYFQHWPDTFAVGLVQYLDISIACNYLARLDDDLRGSLLELLDTKSSSLVNEIKDLLKYPEATAGRLMDPRPQMVFDNVNVQEVLQQLKLRQPGKADFIFVINERHNLVGVVDVGQLVLADSNTKVVDLMKALPLYINALDTDDEVVEKFEGLKANVLPVIDANDKVVGLIRAMDLYQQTKEDLVSDIASMVGASKDEKALSSSWFAFKKRMPWLQINLVTAFLAAAVVGAFESIIAQFTALAILLPVAAGQSGNAGAQALAVTMRGLTLKEISTRQWLKVLRKESMAGLLNGIAIAITCAIGVWVWSQSLGLALVMMLAMVISLTVACGSGALVPIVLKKAGLDPAQSSSIVLTTVTDIVGFMSFLGVATLLADMLPTPA